jgi:hypothetical protein
MVLQLVDISISENLPELKRSYWNTFHCQNKVITSNGRLYGKYCKNRYCTLCSANRKADIINRYLPTIQEWPDQYFLTPTVKAVPYIANVRFYSRLYVSEEGQIKGSNPIDSQILIINQLVIK